MTETAVVDRDAEFQQRLERMRHMGRERFPRCRWCGSRIVPVRLNPGEEPAKYRYPHTCPGKSVQEKLL